MIFDAENARFYDQWLQTPAGRYIDGREKSLILDLISPRGGERVLDVGCGTGEHLLLFKKKGCSVTGIEPSPYMLDIAKKKLGHQADIYMDRAENLPFSDNEFDIVTIISSLEFMENPEKAIWEAIRVCRGRVFIGGFNKLSVTRASWKLKSKYSSDVYQRARLFHVGNLSDIIRTQLQGVRIQWGSVIFLPHTWYEHAAGFEEMIPVMRNPLGAFFGMAFPVTFTYRTIQDIIVKPFKIEPQRKPAHGVARQMRK